MKFADFVKGKPQREIVTQPDGFIEWLYNYSDYLVENTINRRKKLDFKKF